MMKMHSAAATLAFLGAAVAQTTTVEVLNPYFGRHPFDASVQAADATATTYILSCQKNSTIPVCSGDTADLALTLVGGPSTVEVHITRASSDISIEYVGTVADGQMNYQQIITKSGRTLQLANMVMSPLTDASLRVPLTVTAGVEKLSQEAATTAATLTEPTSAQTGTGASDGQATPTSTPNAAAPRAVQKGLVASIAGVAALAHVLTA